MYKKGEEKRSEISKISELLKYSEYIVEPSIPQLTFKPDLMIKLENQLTFIEIAYTTPKETVDWKTLRLLEHIFEVKLFFGNQSVFGLILLDKELWKPYCLELLENFFDKVVYRDVHTISDVYARPKASNFELWDLERKFNRARYKKLSKENLEQFRYQPMSSRELKHTSYNRLIGMNLRTIRNYGIRNLKNYYLKRDMDLRFYFDFFVNGKIVEIKSFKRINNFLIQNLLIKSRLIRYQKIEDKIRQVPQSYKMILLVNGEVSGPQYDQMRYLRMLTAAGWEVYPISILYDEIKARKVFGYD